MNISITFKERRWHIFINGTKIPPSRIAQSVGCSSSYVQEKLKNSPTDEDRIQFIKDLYWKKDNKIPAGTRVYTNLDGIRCTHFCVKEAMPHLHNSVIYDRLHKWACGTIDLDSVYHPIFAHEKKKVKHIRKKKNPKWTALSNKVRNHNLHKIPGPTKYERML